MTSCNRCALPELASFKSQRIPEISKTSPITLVLTYLSPATPCTIKLSLVKVPVLSKQHTSTFPAKGILNGSVQ